MSLLDKPGTDLPNDVALGGRQGFPSAGRAPACPAAPLCVANRLGGRQRASLGPCRVKVIGPQRFSCLRHGRIVGGLEDLEANLAMALAACSRPPREAGRRAPGWCRRRVPRDIRRRRVGARVRLCARAISTASCRSRSACCGSPWATATRARTVSASYLVAPWNRSRRCRPPSDGRRPGHHTPSSASAIGTMLLSKQFLQRRMCTASAASQAALAAAASPAARAALAKAT